MAKYGFAIAISICALLMTLSVDSLRTRTSLVPFLMAVTLSAWAGGFWPALLAAAFSAAAWTLFIVEPTHSFTLEAADVFRLILFLITAILISSLYASRERAMRVAEASERRLQAAIEAACLGIWEYEVETKVFWMSDGFHQKYPPVDGRPIDTYSRFHGHIHSDDRDRYIRSVTHAMGNGEPFELTHRFAGSDDFVVTVGRVHKDSSGKVVRLVGIIISRATLHPVME